MISSKIHKAPISPNSPKVSDTASHVSESTIKHQLNSNDLLGSNFSSFNLTKATNFKTHHPKQACSFYPLSSETKPLKNWKTCQSQAGSSYIPSVKKKMKSADESNNVKSTHFSSGLFKPKPRRTLALA
ncbi:unnamed protein product [Moneuplotes crassus]|uniref:Uncharacterized protein n=1 Tax=Euplotes crassus TaxID=5936 RepID=A0AAD1XU42_EUPCR|nr:unnamed protein product [Moneuplotes crassus]